MKNAQIDHGDHVPCTPTPTPAIVLIRTNCDCAFFIGVLKKPFAAGIRINNKFYVHSHVKIRNRNDM